MSGIFFPVLRSFQDSKPFPYNLNIFGVASKEQNMIVIRPFSSVWADVSLPLLMRSI
jgi:hypothetical protein